MSDCTTTAKITTAPANVRENRRDKREAARQYIVDFKTAAHTGSRRAYQQNADKGNFRCYEAGTTAPELRRRARRCR